MYITKKACLLAAGLLIQSTGLIAQNKRFTIAEATNGLATTLAVQTLKNITWRPGTSTFYQVEKNDGVDVWTASDLENETTSNVISLKQLNRSLGTELKELPAIAWIDKDHLYVMNGKKVELGTVSGNNINWRTWFTLPDKAQNTAIDKHMNIAYTIDNNLYMVAGDNKAIKVTNETNKNIISGQAVHRNEFGIDKGIFLSPKGNYLAYYRMDQTTVKDYPIVKWDADPAVADIIKYPMAGGTSHEVKLRVFNPETGKTVTLKTGEGDHYLTAVTWSPDERHIYVALLNRQQNHLWLNKYDARTGNKVATLFEERDAKYVEPQHSLSFLPGSNDRFIWWSQRDGFAHLYLYNTNGGLVRQITRGNWLVNEIAGFNQAESEVIITASKESPLEKHAYAVNWNTGAIRRLDKGDGTHTISVNEDGTYMLDVYSSNEMPRKAVIRSTDGEYSRTILSAADPLASYVRAEVREVTLRADDGTPLYGKLMLPPDFDEGKRYPTIVYLYNGPHVQLVKNTYPASGNLWYEYMAQRGYIVFTMDGRGSSNRGLDFEQAVFRNLGTVEMRDQLKGVSYLKSLSYVDDNRMGVHGWSFGGFMTTSLMLRHPGVFKCAVAGGPVMDWSMYEVMYTERYMDTPQENPSGYETSNLLTKVKNLDGKLLLIHGTNDDVVVWQHSMKFLKKCVDEGVQVDYFVYPGHPHNVRGKDRVHLMQKITDYFDQNL